MGFVLALSTSRSVPTVVAEHLLGSLLQKTAKACDITDTHIE